MKETVCDLIRDLMVELDLHFTEEVDKRKRHIFRINDPRLHKYLKPLGDCYTKYIPFELKQQSKDNLRCLYDWFVLGDGRIRGDKRRKSCISLSDDVFSVSKQLILDLNEIQFKMGYSGNYHTEARNQNRYIEGRLIEGKNCHEMYFSLRSLTKGVYLDDRFLSMEKVPYEGKVIEVIKEQLREDFANYKANKAISLLAKWLPSANASNKETIRLANKIIAGLKTSPREYRKTLSALRKYSNVIETKTCAKEWGDIDYNAVPSKANIKYANAFLRNDETRRREYLGKLAGGDKSVKINSSVNFPHDVLHMYNGRSGWNYVNLKSYDETIEQLWKNLKDVPGLKDTIVVRDDSGSMSSTVGNTNVQAYEVATALGIYCAERLNANYKNKIITFSHTPRFLDFSDPTHFGSLHSKYEFLLKHSEVADTNIEAVFLLILGTAVENHLKDEDLPKQILILSDMEFNGATCGTRPTVSLFTHLQMEFKKYGYTMPKLIFWNICGRTGTIPCIQNDAGVILVSGFSQNVLSLVNSGKTDPYDALIDELGKERYEAIPFVSFKTSEEKKVETKRSSTKRTVKIDEPSFLK